MCVEECCTIKRNVHSRPLSNCVPNKGFAFSDLVADGNMHIQFYKSVHGGFTHNMTWNQMLSGKGL